MNFPPDDANLVNETCRDLSICCAENSFPIMSTPKVSTQLQNVFSKKFDNQNILITKQIGMCTR